MISPELLRRFLFFSFLDDAQLKAVAMIADEISYDKGAVIIEVGQPADALFVLIEGDVSYYLVATSEHDPYYKKEYFISKINPGEVFGASAMIEPYVYTATLQADKPSKAIKINAPALRALCELDLKLSCGLHRAIAQVMMERLQQTRIQLVAAKP